MAVTAYKTELVQVWKSRVQYLRQFYQYNDKKPKQRGYFGSSRHVWFIPLMLMAWLTGLSSILLLALNVEQMLDTVSVLWNLNMLLNLNLPLMAIWYRLALQQSTYHTQLCYPKRHRLQSTDRSSREGKGSLKVSRTMESSYKQKCNQKSLTKFKVQNKDRRRVVYLLLILAGDVESNPGPVDRVDVTPLEEDDFFEIHDLLQHEQARCYEIGLKLKLIPSTIDVIRKEASDHTDAMTKIITNWLKRNYNVERFGPPTWKALVDAVQAPNGGNNSALAEEIAKKHPAKGQVQVPSAGLQTSQLEISQAGAAVFSTGINRFHETPFSPEHPKILGDDDQAGNAERDKSEVQSALKDKPTSELPPAMSPEDQKRHDIRLKRLAWLSGSFEKGMQGRWKVCDAVELATLIDAVKEDIGHEWKLLGRALKLSQTEIEAIEYDPCFSLKEQIFQLFHTWQRKEGKNATSEVLIAALEKAKLIGILEILRENCVIETTGTQTPFVAETTEQSTATVPVQEPPISPERPKLMGLDNETDDAERDKPKTKPSPGMSDKPMSKLPSALSPEDQKRQDIRLKRLARLSSDEGPFESGSMVKVDPFGYGVVLEMKTKSGDLIAGIEFEKPIAGGGNGELQGVQHFSCNPGHGLYLPYEKLKRDDRFAVAEPVARSNREEIIKPEDESDDDHEHLLKKIITTMGKQGLHTDVSSQCKYPGCSRSKYVDGSTGKTHDFCSRTHAQMSAEEKSDSSGGLVFYIPNDHAGLVIGREGKNILEVERATNTIIKLEPQSASLRSKRRGMIVGSEENCKKAVLMIGEKLSRKVSLHTATSETISVPQYKVGRIIGRNGVTVQAIKQLSGAHDIKFSERAKGLEALLDPNRDCMITGSHEEIEKAKRLIERVIAGEDVDDIIIRALIATKLAGLSFDDDSNCTLS